MATRKTPSPTNARIAQTKLTLAQKLLATALVTQSRCFEHEFPKLGKKLLVLDVTRFLNHRIDTVLMEAIGTELARRLTPFAPDIILTAPSSGNIPAIATALHLPSKPPVIYAPKGVPLTFRTSYRVRSRSYTHGKSVELAVSTDCFPPGARVVICDDFLDTGKTARDLTRLTKQAGSTVVAYAAVIEKPFGGRKRLHTAGFADNQIISLLAIDAMRPGKLKIAGLDEWFRVEE